MLFQYHKVFFSVRSGYSKAWWCLVFNIILLICELDSLAVKSSLWSWECENGKCIPFNLTQENLQSLATCNMVCSSAVLWPLPTGQAVTAKTAVPVRSDMFQVEIVFASTDTMRKHLWDAFCLFKQDLRAMEGKSRCLAEPNSVIVRIAVNDSGDPDMRLDTDESYQLSLAPVSSTSLTLVAEIVANSFCGARHALETLSQLIWLDHYVESLLIVREAAISDEPKFGYRGLMIDTARNHVPFSELMRTVDAMAASKLNTLHWHVSDSQAFSIHLDNVPELSRCRFNRQTDIYTSDQIKALINRARLRGIRVLIEVDIPALGCAWNWGSEYGNLVQCLHDNPWSSYCESPPCDQINPFALEVLQKIYSEIINLTGIDDIFHLGGDDAYETCWTKSFNNSEPTGIWLEFTKSAVQQLEYVNGKLPNLILFWSTNLFEQMRTELKDLSGHIGLQIRNTKWVKKHVNSGLSNVIMSHEDAWDLNSGHGAWYEEKGNVPFNSWQRFYEHRPWLRNDRDNIIGGEATLWSWTLSEGGIDARVWPRAAALAERLWSDHPEGATRYVHARLDMHRARLVARGLNCAPIWSYWCTQNPYTCS